MRASVEHFLGANVASRDRGARAIHWFQRYLAEVRPRLCLDTRETTLFLAVLTGYRGPFHPDVISRMVREWMESFGIKGSCHLLRHTGATHMLEGGADIRFIQQLLGHAKLDVQGLESPQRRVRTVDPKTFEEAARSVFERHGDLMQRLGSDPLAEDRPLIQASADVFSLYDPEEKIR